MPYDEEDIPVGQLDLTIDPYQTPPLPPMTVETPGGAPKPEQDVLRDYFAKQQEAQVKQLQELKSAQQQANDNRFYAQLGGAFNTIGSSLAGVKPDNSAFQGMVNSADRPVEQLKEQQAQKLKGDQIVAQYLLGKQRLDQQKALKDQQLKQDRDLQTERLDAKRESDKRHDELMREMARGRNANKLPPEEAAFVSSLATKSSNKVDIANQITQAFADWDTLDDSAKLTRGRSLLKILNSAQGADAIGAEEARRLGAKLEFAFGNFTNDNPTQFGRDLEGFKTDALLQKDAMERAVGDNTKQIEAITGRKSKIQTQSGGKDPKSRLEELRAKKAAGTLGR